MRLDRGVGATVRMLISGEVVGEAMGETDGERVGSFVLGAMVAEPTGRAGQKVGQALEISPCRIVDKIISMMCVRLCVMIYEYKKLIITTIST